jgi:hypothetical protein
MQDKWAELHGSGDVAESGGEQNNTATDFARHWAIAHIAEVLADQTGEYVILFEYLQDIAVLDSATSPSRIALYQLKKRTRPGWTKSSLTAPANSSVSEDGEAGDAPAHKKPKKLKGRSILGRLYYAVHCAAPLADASGILLTDGHFELDQADSRRVTAYSKTLLTSLGSSDVEFIKKKVVQGAKGTGAQAPRLAPFRADADEPGKHARVCARCHF